MSRKIAGTLWTSSTPCSRLNRLCLLGCLITPIIKHEWTLASHFVEPPRSGRLPSIDGCRSTRSVRCNSFVSTLCRRESRHHRAGGYSECQRCPLNAINGHLMVAWRANGTHGPVAGAQSAGAPPRWRQGPRHLDLGERCARSFRQSAGSRPSTRPPAPLPRRAPCPLGSPTPAGPRRTSCRGPINVRGDRSEHRPLDDVGPQQALGLDPPHAVKGLGERAGGSVTEARGPGRSLAFHAASAVEWIRRNSSARAALSARAASRSDCAFSSARAAWASALAGLPAAPALYRLRALSGAFRRPLHLFVRRFEGFVLPPREALRLRIVADRRQALAGADRRADLPQLTVLTEIRRDLAQHDRLLGSPSAVPRARAASARAARLRNAAHRPSAARRRRAGPPSTGTSPPRPRGR